MEACIVGWAHTPFGKLDAENIESLISRVTRDAIADAGLVAEDIDEIYLGHYGEGFVKERFLSSMPLQVADGLRFTPSTRVENACATGSAALYQGLNAIAAKRAKVVLVVGAEKMTEVKGPQVADLLVASAYLKEEGEVTAGFAGIFGGIAQQYFERYGDQTDALARIAAKNHRNGTNNPYAQFRKDLGFEFCRDVSDRNPYVAPPLKRSDCSAVSDGAAAIVLAERGRALGMSKAIGFRATEHVNDFKPMSRRDMLAFDGCAEAWKRAFAASGTTLDDLSLVETHDCFTVAELIEYEAMGLTPKGRGATAIDEGWTQMGGRLPVNPSGGLKAKGHPIGATGVSMHVLASMQLSGTAGAMQVPDADLVGVFNMGGAAVTHYVSILERVR
jgi:acetyl-CoA C-acetyltransferase